MIYQGLVKQEKKKIEYQVFPREEYLPFIHPKFATKAIHDGQEPEHVHGSINVPIHMSSTFAQKDIGKLYSEFDYCRCGNPTRSAFETVMASLEYGKYAIAFSSGCGAMTSILHLLKTGDHIIACDDVYGGTQRYMRLFTNQKFGIELDFVDMTNLENITKAIKPNTKLIWIETPTNPTLKLIDIEAVTKLAKEKNILTVGDNTFCNPYLQSPLLLGVDISLNSCTKYIGGHSDVVMGVIVTNCEKLNKDLFMAAKSIGACPSPFDSYLCLRGLKTLEVRTIQICRNGYILAHFLEKHPLVEKVIYPGLKSHPQHDIAKKQMRGFGGMISFLIKGGLDEASKFLRALKVFTLAESLGGVEGLAECPALMTHFSVPVETRKQLGIFDNLIRLSVGIEDIDDIVNDINDSLEASTKPNPPKEADK